jgi:hypothetical protein
MSISFSPNQMDLFAKCESTYWTLCFEVRKLLLMQPGEHFGPKQLLNVLEASYREEGDIAKYVTEKLGLTKQQSYTLIEAHALWALFQMSLAQLREGKRTTAQVRDDRKQFVSSLDEYEKIVLWG